MPDQVTQSVEVRTFSSPEEMKQSMHAKTREVIEKIMATPAVDAAGLAYSEAKERGRELKSAQSSLAKRAAMLFAQLRGLSETLEAGLIEAYSKGEAAPDLTARVRALADAEAEHRAVTAANFRILEDLQPQAEIEELERAAEYFLAKAGALRDEALSRIETTARLMAEAAEFEGNIVYDPATTLSGELQAMAKDLEQQADSYRRRAQERAEQHHTLRRELESRRAIALV